MRGAGLSLAMSLAPSFRTQESSLPEFSCRPRSLSTPPPPHTHCSIYPSKEETGKQSSPKFTRPSRYLHALGGRRGG